MILKTNKGDRIGVYLTSFLSPQNLPCFITLKGSRNSGYNKDPAHKYWKGWGVVLKGY